MFRWYRWCYHYNSVPRLEWVHTENASKWKGRRRKGQRHTNNKQRKTLSQPRPFFFLSLPGKFASALVLFANPRNNINNRFFGEFIHSGHNIGVAIIIIIMSCSIPLDL